MEKGERKPAWFKVKIPVNKNFFLVNKTIKDNKLTTVCQEAKCPNVSQCWSNKTATFMILGNICTRDCKFCAVKKGKPNNLNPEEPVSVAQAVNLLEIKHVIITSVTRDDLPDGGASVFSRTIRAIRRNNPQVKIEVLIPDFNGISESLKKILETNPDILNHNLETVFSLYPKINRPPYFYQRSLEILKESRKRGMMTKSGIMVGLGESKEEIVETLKDLKKVGCNIVTIGQYLQPTKAHLPVERYYHPWEFEDLREIGMRMDFDWVESGPLVRSSYQADNAFRQARIYISL
ncbi:MAG: lipoyl synthase [Candidatus Aminicenantia bacterium]